MRKLQDLLPISITGIVQHGKQLGRTLDMPTVNLLPKADLSQLPFGVYYSRVHVGHEIFRGITNVGRKPTVSNEHVIGVETYIYDFNSDLYDREITVDLLAFRRPEQRFASIGELRRQIHEDMEAGRTYGLRS